MKKMHLLKFTRGRLLSTVLLAGILLLSACGGPSYHVRVIETPDQPQLKGTQKPYEVNGQRYQPMLSSAGYIEDGIASWYGEDFHGRKTSNGEIYDMYAMTAAHKILPMNVYVRVTNLRNNKSIVVRINDRGPFVKGRIIDLSYSAAKTLEVVGPGTAPVRVEALGYKQTGAESQVAAYRQPLSYELGPFMVQIGAFTVAENAYRLSAKMKAQYTNTAVVEAMVGGKKFYRVRVGLYGDMSVAQQAMQTLELNGFPNSFIVAKD